MKNRQFFPLFSLSALLFSGALSSCAQTKTPTSRMATAQAPTSSTRKPVQPAKVVDVWTKRRAIYDYDRRVPLELKSISRQSNNGVLTEKMSVRGVRGATEPFYIVTPAAATANNRAPGLILIHGLGGDIEQMLFVAQLYANQGYASLIPEIVNHGERYSNSHARFGTDVTSLRSDIIESVGDIRRTLDVFAARPQIDAQRIGLVGISLGSILGTMTTSVDERIATAVFTVGGADWRTILGQSDISSSSTKDATQKLSAAQIALLDDVDPKNFVGHIAPRPILLLNGKRDNIIPVAAARTFFQSAREPKKQIWFDSGHLLPVLEVAAPINDWLEDHLKKPAAT
ncbi:MAG TPA: dienelactone hydrolase family protein, partial [Abditibacteriaceae bacterium]|nr:dienelactone hydrolase family protein [Abditibacteriaceae bacterium]